MSTFEQLMTKNKSVTTHERNLQLLKIEIFKTKSHLNPDCMTEIFKDRNVSHNLRRRAGTVLPAVRTTAYGIETARFIGNKQ